MRRQAVSPNLCDHHTGCYSGQCRAGVAYESVKDQDRRDQMARFPCDRSLSSFTTCDRAQFTPLRVTRKRVGLSDKNRERAVVFEREQEGVTRKVRGLLVGWTDDRETVFISVKAGRRRQVIAAPVERCYLARGGSGGDEGRDRTGDLPLFDLREAPAPERSGRRELKEEKAA